MCTGTTPSFSLWRGDLCPGEDPVPKRLVLKHPCSLPPSLGTSSHAIFYYFCPFLSLFHSSSQFPPVQVIKSNTAHCPVMENWNIALNYLIFKLCHPWKIKLHFGRKIRIKTSLKGKMVLNNFHLTLHVFKLPQYSSNNFGLFWPEKNQSLSFLTRLTDALTNAS